MNGETFLAYIEQCLVIGHLPVASIDVTLVTKVLEPIWSTKPGCLIDLCQNENRVLSAGRDLSDDRAYRRPALVSFSPAALQPIRPARAQACEQSCHPYRARRAQSEKYLSLIHI